MKTYEHFNEEAKIEIEYYHNGQKWFEMWYLNSKKHREDGPALQHWHNSGQKFYNIWY